VFGRVGVVGREWWRGSSLGEERKVEMLMLCRAHRLQALNGSTGSWRLENSIAICKHR
jgi:hypothetical protein